jgi:phosphoenolpyruvate synthase/pyruvate phosphate dikinase
MERFLRRFEELRLPDVPLVGGKNTSLGELHRELARAVMEACLSAARGVHHAPMESRA